MILASQQAEQLAQLLAGRLEGEAWFDEHCRALYATDASLYQIMPAGVVLPRSEADVVAAVNACRELKIPLICRGSGTSLSGQSIGPGLVLDFSRHMNAILAIDPHARTARVQPGVVLDQLNRAAAAHGLQFGPDVATSNRANLGGMIGNNSAGSRSVLHGKTVDHVLALEVVLSDGSRATLQPLNTAQLAAESAAPGCLGDIHRRVVQIVEHERQEILDRYPKVLRRVSGYNLDEFVPEFRALLPTPPGVARARAVEQGLYPNSPYNLSKLFVGAEGTLGCVTEALLHLVPLPQTRGVVVLHFDSLAAAVAPINGLLELGPSAVELFDGLIVRLADRNLHFARQLDFVVGRPESLVIVEFSGDSADEVRDRMAALEKRLLGQPGLSHLLPALDPQTCEHIWACRKAALPLLMSVPGSRKPIAFVEDTAVDPPKLAEFVVRFRKILADAGTEGAYYGHASVGCLHIRPLLDAANREDLARLERISREVAELVLEFGGAMSGEHGDGLARSYLNERLFGPRLYRAFQEIKQAADPEGIFNPGKIVDGPSPIENLRYGAELHRLPVTTTFDFSREGGLVGAAEMCSGVGACRKLQTGTMCPSFMITRDEEHSTRGRANALRLALSGGLPREALTGPRMLETFELCLGCKGCKAECPSNVDVAKMKAELLNLYHREHGAPLAARLVGQTARINRWGSALAPLANALAAAPGSGWLRERLTGFDRRRPLPRFERQSFQRWFARRGAADRPAPRGDVVLLDDCLTSYCEPRVNQAAVQLLEAAGYRVHLAGLECCGRTLISKGLLGEAQRLAKVNVAKLAPWAERGAAIVGCEPSCILTLVDDYQDLVPGEATRHVGVAAVLIDGLLAQVELPLPSGPPRQVLLHGHCHQKALVGLADTQKLLQAAGCQVSVVDSGCCGLAGSWGYEHYDLSMQIGQRVLFPAVLAAENATIAAPGFSCRHQIEHGTGWRALHPVELAAAVLSL
ncbi:MAG: FAD-linked oxidase C-terminal domain-containing protein [Pirellulales bacterium]